MQTIQAIAEIVTTCRKFNIGQWAAVNIGPFKLNYGTRYIQFKLRFRPDHIQNLLFMGVKIKFDTVVMADLSEKSLRFKKGREAIKQGRYAPYYFMGNPANAQTRVTENWLEATASSTVETLIYLDRFCRDNYLYGVAIHNDHILTAAGWRKKVKYAKPYPMLLSRKVAKAIRRNVSQKKKSDLLPIELRAMKQKQYE